MSRGLVLALILTLLPTFGFPQAPEYGESDSARMGDAGEYMDQVDKLKDAPVNKQLEGWKQYLADHPDTSFRSEIEQNVRNLETMRTETDPVRRKETRDTERYLRAVEFSKKLTFDDQVALWEQFLEENPKSLYLKEVHTTLEELKAKRKGAPVASPVAPIGAPRKDEPIASNLAYLDKQTATLLATFPGLIVPGMGHWYTKDYTVASILTGLRVGAIAFGVPGIVQGNNTMIIAASVIYGFTYLVDVIDTPFSVDRYNEALEGGGETSVLFDVEAGHYTAGLNYTFTF